MKANAYFGAYDVRVVDVPEPRLVDPTDVVVRLTTGAICGSDLHTYHGRNDRRLANMGLSLPRTTGHEFVGVVEEVGPGVATVQRGDRVVSAFRTACGRCELCQRGLPGGCARGQLFGFDLEGAQAEYVRVPLADHTLATIPAGLTDEQVIFVGDIFSTGYMAAEQAGIRTGDRVVVFGCGPVGLFAQLCAQFFGPSVVYAVDKVPERLARAKELGSVPIDATTLDPVQEVRRQTDGGADVAIEAIGAEATLLAAIDAVRTYGRVSVVGVFSEPTLPFPIGQAFSRGLSLVIGRCHVQRYMPQLMRLIETGRVDLTPFVSHVMPLAETPRGYELFDKRDALKVLLKP